MKMHRLVLIIVMAVAGTGPLAVAQDKTWVGKRIMMKKDGVKFSQIDKMGQQVVVGEPVQAVMDVLGEEGGRLQVRSLNLTGWFDKADAVLLESAHEYFNGLIRTDSRNAWAWKQRAVAVWFAKGDRDRAMKDLDEAVRLEPKFTAALNNRGALWSQKGEYDKAIMDFDEAVRLDPKWAPAFYNRGHAWYWKEDYRRAIKDFDEAIRLELKHAAIFHDQLLEKYSK